MPKTCPNWCTGSCAHANQCASEWSTTRSVDGAGTVRLRRTSGGIQVEAGRTLAANAVTLDMPAARLLYTALGRVVHAT